MPADCTLSRSEARHIPPRQASRPCSCLVGWQGCKTFPVGAYTSLAPDHSVWSGQVLLLDKHHKMSFFHYHHLFCRAVRLGLLSPRDLVKPSLLATVREMVGRQNSLEERLLGRPLIAYRLLCTAILATYCGILYSDWVQNVALIVLDEFRIVLNISNVVAVDLMYSSLRSPLTLQTLTRRTVVTSLRGSPGDIKRICPISKSNLFRFCCRVASCPTPYQGLPPLL